MRDAGREVSLYRGALPAASSAALAAQLLGKYTLAHPGGRPRRTHPPHAGGAQHLDPVDREILSLRHFEELTAAETAQVLGIEESAAAKRYFRALKRLKQILADMPGGQEGI